MTLWESGSKSRWSSSSNNIHSCTIDCNWPWQSTSQLISEFLAKRALVTLSLLTNLVRYHCEAFEQRLSQLSHETLQETNSLKKWASLSQGDGTKTTRLETTACQRRLQQKWWASSSSDSLLLHHQIMRYLNASSGSIRFFKSIIGVNSQSGLDQFDPAHNQFLPSMTKL